MCLDLTENLKDAKTTGNRRGVGTVSPAGCAKVTEILHCKTGNYLVRHGTRISRTGSVNSCNVLLVVVVVAFSSPARILGGMFDHSFPACAFFFFIKWRLFRAH